MPKVLNYYVDGLPAGAIDCRRPGPWGNPFYISRDRNRDLAVALHRDYVLARPNVQAAVKREMRGKDLVCVCKPLACHCDIYLEIANS